MGDLVAVFIEGYLENDLKIRRKKEKEGGKGIMGIFSSKSRDYKAEIKELKKEIKPFKQRRKVEKLSRELIKLKTKPVRKAGFLFEKSIREFAEFQPPDFTRSQEVMREIMSGGQVNKIWGTGENLPRLNHDLNPRQRGDLETAKMFGLE